jgi:hypothetical protein
MWLCNKRFGVANIVTSAVYWSIWKMINSLCFQDVAWRDMNQLWQRVLLMLKCWKILLPQKMMVGLEGAISSLEKVLAVPEAIEFKPSVETMPRLRAGELMPEITCCTCLIRLECCFSVL